MNHYRTQTDDLGDAMSLITGIVFPEDEPGARQEFAADADINILLRRYGVGQAPNLPYGEVDYDIGLQRALQVVQEAQSTFQAMPEAIRQAYGSWTAFMAAVERGEVEISDKPFDQGDQAVTSPSDNAESVKPA